MNGTAGDADDQPNGTDAAQADVERAAESADDERATKVARILDDLKQFARTAERIVARGPHAYLDPDDDLLRRAGRSVVVDVSAAVDRLPEEFRAKFPDIPWRNIRDTRNYVAHQYELVRDDLIWEALRTDIPELVARITDTSSQ